MTGWALEPEVHRVLHAGGEVRGEVIRVVRHYGRYEGRENLSTIRT
jgi:hypothetical protein